MRRLFLVFAAVALLAACSSDDSAKTSGSGSGGAGGAAAGSLAGDNGTGGVTSSALGAPGGAGAGGSGTLAPGVADRVLFDTDRSALAADARATLDRQAGWLQQSPGIAVQIAGNADERGTEEYNLALGERRAEAARDYLVSRGVQGSRISTISYGKDRPTALGSTPDAWAQNRNAITSPR
jgi:peptidoglycan-associated lipoprotein